MSMWGTKLVYRRLGYVADFCPICISARPFVLERVGAAKHILNLSIGGGELVDNQRVCLHCATAFRADPQQYAAVAKNLDTIEPLTLETFPTLAQAHSPRLALEQQVLAAPDGIAPDTRAKLLLEPFTLLSPRVVKRFESAHFEVAHAYLRREILPLLAQTLARLRPSEAELQATLNELVRMKDLIGAKIKLPELMAQLSAHQAGTAPEIAANPIKHHTGGGKPPYRNAALIFKVLGWLAAGFSAIMVIVIFGELLDGKATTGGYIGLWIVCAVVTGSQFLIGMGLERQKNWARVTAIIFSIGFLFAFPIGTVIGAYIIWALTAAWEA